MTANSLPMIGLVLAIAVATMIVLTRYANIHAFFSLLLAAVIFGLATGQPMTEVLTTMQMGFGALLQKIGLLVALGSCLGMLMEQTGAMEVIGKSVVSSLGHKRTLLAMTAIGVLVGIPVFCDSGFIILSRLVPALAAQTSFTQAQLYLALSSGLYTTHTLVPPTPGPLAAAANLGLTPQVGTVVLVGLAVSVPVASVSFFLSKILGANIHSTAETKTETQANPGMRPFVALIPLVLPVLLIALTSFSSFFDSLPALGSVLSIIGHPVVALFLGCLVASTFIRREQRNLWPHWISTALKDAGLILLITGAGGAFGAVIGSSNIASLLEGTIVDMNARGVLFLIIAYALAAVLKTAQGSTTSSLIITSSLVMPVAAAAGFTTPLQLSILAAALGGGAMTVSHGNDSYFWVVSQFGGMQAKDAFRSFSLITLAQGLTALIVSILFYLLL